MRIGFQALSFTVLSALGIAQAVPIYYTFTGTVTYAGSPEYTPGQTVTFVLVADRDLPGYTNTPGGPQDNIPDGSGYDYFLADYVGGNALTADLPTHVDYSLHYGFTSANHSGLVGSNGDLSGYDFIRVDNYSRNIDQWTLGMGGFTGENSVLSGTTWERSYFNLTLTGISDLPPGPAVPEPSTAVLSGIGLLGLALARRRGRGFKT